MTKLYLDHAATTPLDPAVMQAMLPHFTQNFGNGLSQHSYGQAADGSIGFAREKIAKLLGATSSEIYFCGSGSEANNWAIRGVIEANEDKGNHVIASAIEHPSVIEALKYLEKKGVCEVSWIKPDEYGFISSETVESAIKSNTILIAIMAANNEIGTLQPIAEIGKIAKAKKICFFTDAVQAAGSIKLDVKEIGCDLLSLSAHKFFGPKGVAVLYKRAGVKINRLIHGGEQERSLRAGTHNNAGIVGMAEAFSIACRDMEKNDLHVRGLRKIYEDRVIAGLSEIRVNSSAITSKSLAGTSSISINFVEGESMLLRLDLAGIAVSSGSACSSGSLRATHVILALGVDVGLAQGTIRVSFSKNNTHEDAVRVADELIKVVKSLRAISPLFKQFGGGSRVV